MLGMGAVASGAGALTVEAVVFRSEMKGAFLGAAAAVSFWEVRI
jgi:hypothetical protein